MAIGLALIGAGIFIKEQHLTAVATCPNLVLRAVYSRSRQSCEALEAGVDIYSDDATDGKTYTALLARSDIQAVIIALPILKQPEFIESALRAGKHVLSEKPIAKDLATAQALIKTYRQDESQQGATWAVAENFRYLQSFLYAREQIERLGPILGFNITAYSNTKAGSKYFETAWRKTPEYQGGFLLDGGVHKTAAARLLLGADAKPSSISAFTTLVKQHLPPVDTMHAIWQLETGVAGTFSTSHGSPTRASEYIVICERGSVSVSGGNVVTRLGEDHGDSVAEKAFPDEGSGVRQEVTAWARGLVVGKPNAQQAPEQALADLELVEKMLRSGEKQGAPCALEYQV